MARKGFSIVSSSLDVSFFGLKKGKFMHLAFVYLPVGADAICLEKGVFTQLNASFTFITESLYDLF